MEYKIAYEMEELAPVVGWLAEKYTSGESTSISYEKAEQLMGAVLYCIQEISRFEPKELALAERLSARQAYDIGAALVEEKVRKALNLYHDLLPEFEDYGNSYLHDTIIKEMPRFFQSYDVRFEPQNTILTLDYPVMRDLSSYSGIDQIYEYLKCIRSEQIYLKQFPKHFLIDGKGEDGENLCEKAMSIAKSFGDQYGQGIYYT